MRKSIFDRLKDLFIFHTEQSPTVAFSKSSKGSEYRDRLFDMADNIPIPYEVWDSIPQELKGLVIAAQKNGAKISYEPNCRSGILGFLGKGKTFDKITIKSQQKGTMYTSSYNAKNGVMTYSGSNSGPLFASGMFFDPETGESAGMFVS
jgi:hypothetical protein